MKLGILKNHFFHKPILDEISFTIQKGESVALAGPNGAGKTTLLRIIAGIASSDAGDINCSFKPLLYMGHAPGLYAGLSLRENVKLFAGLHQQPLDPNIMEKTFSNFGLGNHSHKPTRVLSQGMLQRLKLVIGSLLHWDFLLFDEPFNALDEDGQSLAKTLIKEWVAKRKTILFVDHNKARSHELSSRQIILSGGHIQKENQA